MAPQPTPFDNFAIPSEQVLANYSYQELLTGEGIITFQLVLSENSTTTNYLIKTDAIVSDPTFKRKQNASETFNWTFDTNTFKFRRIIEGTVYISFTHKAAFGNAGCSNYLTVALYHYDGTTETSLGSVTSPTVSDNSTDTYATRLITIDVSKRIFQKGDILRAKLTWVASGASGSYTNAVYFDPTTYPFKVQVPFKINI